jgi:hypothetical protein
MKVPSMLGPVTGWERGVSWVGEGKGKGGGTNEEELHGAAEAGGCCSAVGLEAGGSFGGERDIGGAHSELGMVVL